MRIAKKTTFSGYLPRNDKYQLHKIIFYDKVEKIHSYERMTSGIVVVHMFDPVYDGRNENIFSTVVVIFGKKMVLYEDIIFRDKMKKKLISRHWPFKWTVYIQ